MKLRSMWLVVLALAACSKSQTEGNKSSGGTAIANEGNGPAASRAGASPTEMQKAPDKAPPPDDQLKGAARVVNLLVDEAGKPITIDVWGRRWLTWGPRQFAANVGYGQVTPHFGIGKGMATVAVVAGGGPDAKEIGSLFGPQDGEELTTVMFRNDGRPASIVLGMKPPGTMNAPEPPPAGKGLLMVFAMPLSDHEKALTEPYGGRSFYVGDGSTTCLHQRVQDQGMQPAILGGTNPTLHDLPPGPAKITMHKWLPGKDCTTPAVFETEVEVKDGGGTLLILHSPDGKKIEALPLPMWR